jgi:hypothetical protein
MTRYFWKGVIKQDGIKGAVKSDVLSMVTRYGTIQMEDIRKHFLCFVQSQCYAVFCRIINTKKD